MASDKRGIFLHNLVDFFIYTHGTNQNDGAARQAFQNERAVFGRPFVFTHILESFTDLANSSWRSIIHTFRIYLNSPKFSCREIEHFDCNNRTAILRKMVSSQIISANIERLDTIMQIKSANIILYCKKWEEMVAFYQTGLKLPITTSTEWFVEFKLTRTSQLSVANESHTSIKSGSGKGITIGLKVADLVTAHSQLKAAGLNPTAVKEIWGAKAFYVFDPEGNRLEFWSGRAKS